MGCCANPSATGHSGRGTRGDPEVGRHRGLRPHHNCPVCPALYEIGLASRSSRLASRCVLLGGLAACSSRLASRCCRVGSPLAPRGSPPAVFCWVGSPLGPQGSPPAVFCWVGCLSAGWFSPLVLEHALEYALLTCPLRDPEILRLSTVGQLLQLVLGISFLSR